MGILQAFLLDALKSHFPKLYDTLRLNLLSGELNLRDVELPETAPFCFRSLPLQLRSGTIGSLILQRPWTSRRVTPIRIKIRALHLDLFEISFPHLQTQVFEAFRTEENNLKSRSLAQGERSQNVLSKVLRKLASLTLERLEVSVEDFQVNLTLADGSVALLRVSGLTAGRIPDGVTSVIPSCSFALFGRGLYIRYSAGSGSCPAFELRELDFCFTARLSDDVVKVDLSLEEDPSVSVSPSVVDAVDRITERTTQWSVAFREGRPSSPVSDCVVDWFRYAYRFVVTTHGKNKFALQPSTVRSVMRAFIQYKELHVKRLSTRKALRADEAERIEELENLLTTEAILCLRSQARKDVLAEEVSAFAANEWLRWAVVGHSMSPEREELVTSLRRSLAVPSGESLLGDPCSSKDSGEPVRRVCVQITVILKVLSISLSQHSPIRCRIRDTVLRGEIDLHCGNCALDFSVTDLSVFDGTRRLGRRGPLQMPPEVVGNHVPLLRGSFKTSDDELMPLRVQVQPWSFHGNASSWMNCCKIFVAWTKVLSPKLRASDIHETERYRAAPSSRAVSLPFVDIYIVSLNIVYAIRDGGLDGCLVACMRNTKVGREGSGAVGPMHGETDFSLYVGSVEPQASVAAANAIWKEFFSGSVESTSSDLNFRCHIAFQATDTSTILVKLSHAKMWVSLCALDYVLLVLDSLLERSGIYDSSTTLSRDADLDIVEDRSLERLREQSVNLSLEVSEAVLNLANSVAQGASPRVFVIDLRRLNLRVQGDEELLLSVNAISVSETYLGKVLLLKASENALSTTALDVRIYIGHVECVEVNLCSAVAKVSPAVIEVAHHSVCQIVNSFGNIRLHAPRKRKEDSNCRVAVVLRSLHLDCVDCNFQARLVCMNTFFVASTTMMSASLESAMLFDTRSSPWVSVLTSGPVNDAYSAESRAVAFSFAENSVSVRLSSARITIVKSFVGGLVHFFRTFQQRSTHGPGDEGASSAGLGQPYIALNGSKIAVLFPVPHAKSTLKLDLRRLVATFSGMSETFSCRKLALLRSCRQVRHLSGTSSVSDQGWYTIVDSMDFDLSHCLNGDTSGDTHSTIPHHIWNVEILSALTVRVSPTAVQEVVSAITHLNDWSHEDYTDESAPDASTVNKSSHAQGRLCERSRITLFCRAESVRADLVDESANNSRTIARVESDQTRVTWKSADVNGRSTVKTNVATWVVNCGSIRLLSCSAEAGKMLISIGHSKGVNTDTTGSYYNCPLSFKAMRRTDSRTTSAYDMALGSLTLNLDSSLETTISAVTRLIATVSMHWGSSSSRTAAPSRDAAIVVAYVDRGGVNRQQRSFVDGKPTPAVQQSGEDKTASTRLSVLVVDPVVLLVRVSSLGRPQIKVQGSNLKASVLFGANGHLLSGSHFKVGEVAVFMQRVTQTRHGNLGRSDLFRNPSSAKRSSADNLFPRDGADTSSSRSGYGNSRYSLQPRKELDRRASHNQDKKAEIAEDLSVIVCQDLQARMPHGDEGRWYISVSRTVISCSPRTFRDFLDAVQATANMQESVRTGETCVPDVKISVKNVSAHLNLPHLVKSRKSRCVRLVPVSGKQYTTAIRLYAMADFTLFDDLTSIEGCVKMSADVLDETKGFCDSLLQSSSLKFAVDLHRGVTAFVEFDRLIRMSFSPLSAAALSAFVWSWTSHDREEHTSDTILCERRCGLPSEPGQLEIRTCFKSPGFVIRFLSEWPRSQVLRLLVRDVWAEIRLCQQSRNLRNFSVSFRDLLVEDTLSWRFRWPEEEIQEFRKWVQVLIVRGARCTTPMRCPASARRSARDSSLSESQQAVSGDLSGYTSLPAGNRLDTASRVAWVWSRHPSPRQQTISLSAVEIQINLDVGMVPVYSELVQNIYHHLTKLHDPESIRNQDGRGVPGMRHDAINLKSIFYFDLGPTDITLAIRAASRAIQRSTVRVLLAAVLGPEASTDVTLHIPESHFKYESVTEIEAKWWSRFAASASTLLVPNVMHQGLLQFGRLWKLLGVFAVSLFGGRNHDLFRNEDNALVQNWKRGPVGLLTILDADTSTVYPARVRGLQYPRLAVPEAVRGEIQPTGRVCLNGSNGAGRAPQSS